MLLSFNYLLSVALFSTTLLFNAHPAQAAPGGGSGHEPSGRHRKSVHRRLGHELAPATAAAPSNGTESLEKRQGTNARFTYFATGLGACGGYNQDSDYIVALNTPQWDGGAHCGKTITITIGGVTGTATIVDQCPGCPSGGLDFSIGLFQHFQSDLGVGTLTGSWVYGTGAAAVASSSTHKTTATPTPTPTPTPTKTSTTPTTTSTKISSSSAAAPSSSSAPASSKSSTDNSSSATASASSTPTSTSNLGDMNTLLVEMGIFVVMASAD